MKAKETVDFWPCRIIATDAEKRLCARQAEQKKFIGNAVEVNMSRVLCEALARKLMDKAA